MKRASQKGNTILIITILQSLTSPTDHDESMTSDYTLQAKMFEFSTSWTSTVQIFKIMHFQNGLSDLCKLRHLSTSSFTLCSALGFFWIYGIDFFWYKTSNMSTCASLIFKLEFVWQSGEVVLAPNDAAAVSFSFILRSLPAFFLRNIIMPTTTVITTNILAPMIIIHVKVVHSPRKSEDLVKFHNFLY